MDIMHIFQGPIELKRCEMKHHICRHVQACALHQKIKEIEAYAAHILQGVTIQHIVEGVGVLL